MSRLNEIQESKIQFSELSVYPKTNRRFDQLSSLKINPNLCPKIKILTGNVELNAKFKVGGNVYGK